MGLDTLRNSKVYFDANILIYAIEGYEDYRVQNLQLFQHVSDNNCQIISSELTYAECLVKPLKDNDEDSIRNYEKSLIDSAHFQLAPVSLGVLRRGALLHAHQNVKLPDAIHVATAIESGCTHIVSNDKKLPDINGLDFVYLKDLRK